MHSNLMDGLSVNHLRFTVRAKTPIVLTTQPGSAIRGVLYKVLSRNFCSEPDGPHTQFHTDNCPVCWLLANSNDRDARGENQPRPITIQPPVPGRYQPGQTFTFGISLIGAAQNMLPYIARAVQRSGETGIGPGRGKFELVTIGEYSPLWDAQRDLMRDGLVVAPTLQVTSARVNELATRQGERVTLEFITPLRLTANKTLVKHPNPLPLIQRLVERCQRIALYYAENPAAYDREQWKTAYNDLSELAQGWAIVHDETRWVEVHSGSRKKGTTSPISGLTGTVHWSGDISPALTWLLWGQSLHVGKSAVKGNGWYRVTW
ncbi:MAG: CRISPR system precrRNA processing endoribonuclease RAMP protein Cas6 [Chloroflexota bacterium]